VLSKTQRKRIGSMMNPLRKQISLSDRELGDLCLKLYLKYEIVYLAESEPGETDLYYIFPNATLKQVINYLKEKQ
jgi:hypothetical protein